MEIESFCVIPAHQRCVKALASSPMATCSPFVSASASASESVADDRSVAFWHQRDLRYELLHVYKDERSRFMSSIACSLDGTHVAFSYVLELNDDDDADLTWVESRIRVCSVNQDIVRQVAFATDMNFVLCLCFLHNNDYLAYGCDNGSINVIRRTGTTKTNKTKPTDFEKWQTLHRHRKGVLSIQFCLEAKLLVTTSHDSTVSICKLQDDMRLKPLKTLRNHTNSVSGVAFSSTKLCFATVAYDGIMCVWSVDTLGCISTVRFPNVLQCVAAFPGRDAFAIGARDGTLFFWNKDLASPKQIRLTKRSIECIAFLRECEKETTRLAFGARDGLIRVCKLKSSQEVKEE